MTETLDLNSLLGYLRNASNKKKSASVGAQLSSNKTQRNKMECAQPNMAMCATLYFILRIKLIFII